MDFKKAVDFVLCPPLSQIQNTFKSHSKFIQNTFKIDSNAALEYPSDNWFTRKIHSPLSQIQNTFKSHLKTYLKYLQTWFKCSVSIPKSTLVYV